MVERHVDRRFGLVADAQEAENHNGKQHTQVTA